MQPATYIQCTSRAANPNTRIILQQHAHFFARLNSNVKKTGQVPRAGKNAQIFFCSFSVSKKLIYTEREREREREREERKKERKRSKNSEAHLAGCRPAIHEALKRLFCNRLVNFVILRGGKNKQKEKGCVDYVFCLQFALSSSEMIQTFFCCSLKVLSGSQKRFFSSSDTCVCQMARSSNSCRMRSHAARTVLI